MTRTLKLIPFFIYQIMLAHCARILGVIPSPSYSHQIVYRPLWKELSLRGHQVTVLTTDPINDKSLTNLTEVDLSFSYDIWNRDLKQIVNTEDIYEFYSIALKSLEKVLDKQLSHPEVKNLIQNKDEHFDLLITEIALPATTAFAERFKCPFIGVTSYDAPLVIYGLVGNPIHPTIDTDISRPFGEEVNFIERLKRALLYLIDDYIMMHYFANADTLMRKHFGEHYPPLNTILQNISMLFTNSDPIFHQIRPLVPAVVQIGGGGHRDPPKPIPKELQKYLDGATEGFIYFSLGSNVKSKDLPDSTRKIILETFSELPYKVLWKFEIEDLPGKPENVFISKWFPQQDIFKHPNIKLFITQGGLQSIDEATYDNVPMIGIPFFGDQQHNVKRIVHQGLGLSLDRKALDKTSFRETILEVINNPKYKATIGKLASLATDQPMTGLERAVWWTEYVIRHKGINHLRSPLLDLPKYQYYLLDVLGFCFIIVIVFSFFIVKLIRLTFKLIRWISTSSKVKTT